MSKIHAGWGQYQGIKLCGSKETDCTVDEDKVTCVGCLRKIYDDLYKAWRDKHHELQAAEVKMNRAYLRLMP